jgi:hypothetical protein
MFIHILIIVATAGYGQPANVAIDHVEFGTKEACLAARNALINRTSDRARLNYTTMICVKR